MDSTTVAPYHVVLWSNSYDGNRSISHFNGTTNETLNIELKNYGPMRSVAVRRARKGN